MQSTCADAALSIQSIVSNHRAKKKNSCRHIFYLQSDHGGVAHLQERGWGWKKWNCSISYVINDYSWAG